MGASDEPLWQILHATRFTEVLHSKLVYASSGTHSRDDAHNGHAEAVVETHHALGTLRRPAEAVPQAVEVSLSGSHVGRQPGPEKHQDPRIFGRQGQGGGCEASRRPFGARRPYLSVDCNRNGEERQKMVHVCDCGDSGATFLS